MNGKSIAVALILAGLAGCDTSPPPASAPATRATDRLKDDFRQTGQDLKEAAKEIADKAKPAYDQVKEKSRQAVHDLATTIAEKTAGGAATQPATQAK